MKICTRCGNSDKIESHHIVFKSLGGSDDKENRKNLCQACHDFVHAEEAVKRSLVYYEKRVKLLEYRLQVLNELNTPENIKKLGYRSYWVDEKTHGEYNKKGRKKYVRKTRQNKSRK